MSDLRVLTDAELDIVGGGAVPRLIQGGGGVIQLVEEVIVDILQLFEPSRPKPLVTARY
jgi:hypothetical protein